MAKKKRSSSNALETQNAAKTLLANIRFMSVDNPIRSIAVTSSVPNEGKTTVSVQLARAIASSGKSCLLVEADMRRRSLGTVLDVHPQAGVYSVLVDSVPLAKAVTPTKTPNLYMLDVEPNIPNPADIISSKRYRRMVENLRNKFDYVVYDTPPVGTFVDAAILSTMVDGVVMVVRPGRVKRRDLADAYDQLEKAGANVLGLCANFCEITSSGYYYAYYTRDGKRVKNHTHKGDKQEVAMDVATAPFTEDELAGAGASAGGFGSGAGASAGGFGSGTAGGREHVASAGAASSHGGHAGAGEPDLRFSSIPSMGSGSAAGASGHGSSAAAGSSHGAVGGSSSANATRVMGGATAGIGHAGSSAAGSGAAGDASRRGSRK